MPDQAALVQAAMLVREAAPERWEAYVLSLRHYAAEVAMEMVRADPEKLARAQGMALQANEIATIMIRVPELWQKIATAREEDINRKRTRS